LALYLHSRLFARSGPAWQRRLACLCCLVLLAAGIGRGSASAQSLIADDPKDLYHWTYAAAFGTGAYHIGDADLFAVRINPKYKLATFHDDRFSLNLRLPVTLGLQSIDIEEIVSTPIAEQFATLCFVPGLGTREHMRLWLLKFDRVGIGYRKGDEIEGVRLFFDSVFD